MRYIPFPLYIYLFIAVLMPISVFSQSFSKSERTADLVEYGIKDRLPITNS